MTKLKDETLIRVYALDSLVAESGKVLTPDRIGKIAQEISINVTEAFVKKNACVDAASDKDGS